MAPLLLLTSFALRAVTNAQEQAREPTEETPFPDLLPTEPLPVLVRATNSKSKRHRSQKIKWSTVVNVDALEAFYARYAEVCKTGMTALKPRDRARRKPRQGRRRGGTAVGGGPLICFACLSTAGGILRKQEQIGNGS